MPCTKILARGCCVFMLVVLNWGCKKVAVQAVGSNNTVIVNPSNSLTSSGDLNKTSNPQDTGDNFLLLAQDLKKTSIEALNLPGLSPQMQTLLSHTSSSSDEQVATSLAALGLDLFTSELKHSLLTTSTSTSSQTFAETGSDTTLGLELADSLSKTNAWTEDNKNWLLPLLGALAFTEAAVIGGVTLIDAWRMNKIVSELGSSGTIFTNGEVTHTPWVEKNLRLKNGVVQLRQFSLRSSITGQTDEFSPVTNNKGIELRLAAHGQGLEFGSESMNVVKPNLSSQQKLEKFIGTVTIDDQMKTEMRVEAVKSMRVGMLAAVGASAAGFVVLAMMGQFGKTLFNLAETENRSWATLSARLLKLRQDAVLD